MPEIRRPLSANRGFSSVNSEAESNAVTYNQINSVNNRSWWPWATGALIVLIVVIAVVKLWTGTWLGWGGERPAWQGVFLSNNTVYFGHVSSQNSWVTLRDIYYLQRAQTPQPSGEEVGENKLVLIKLGNELHGPEDYMKINKDHVIFIENLRPDSQVVKAIEKYLQDQGRK